MKIFIEEKDGPDAGAVLILSNKEARAFGNLIEEAQKKQPDAKKLRRLSKPFSDPVQENLAVF